MNQYLIVFFNGRIIFQYMGIAHLDYLFISKWMLGLFPHFGCCE